MPDLVAAVSSNGDPTSRPLIVLDLLENVGSVD